MKTVKMSKDQASELKAALAIPNSARNGKYLLSYHGGGYDGCIWEWNYTLIDFRLHELTLTFVITTGALGARDFHSQMRMIDNHEGSYYLNPFPSGWDAFVEDSAPAHVLTVAKALDMEVKCPECEQMENPEYCRLTGEHGNGGIGVEYRGFLCEDCYTTNSCSYCGEYLPDEEFDEDGRCEYCAERQQKQEAAENAKQPECGDNCHAE